MANNPVLLDNKAYKKYEYLANINDPLQIAKLLLFHIFVLRQLLRPIKIIKEKMSEISLSHFEIYRAALQEAFIEDPLKITEYSALRSKLLNKTIELCEENGYRFSEIRNIFDSTLSYNWNRFLSIFSTQKSVDGCYAVDNVIIEPDYSMPKWEKHKLPNLNTTINSEFAEGLTKYLEKILQKIKNKTNTDTIDCKFAQELLKNIEQAMQSIIKEAKFNNIDSGFVQDVFESFKNIKKNITKTNDLIRLLENTIQKIKDAAQKDVNYKFVINLREPLDTIIQKIKKNAKARGIRITDSFNDKKFMSVKNNRVLELCFIYIKYANYDKLLYRDIYKDLNIAYTKINESKYPDTIIRKNSMKLLNELLTEADIYKLQAYIQRNRATNKKLI